ncbi:hypothetical protein GCM10011390_41860 [Aureimonas endophytica]|uniref:Chromosomal replication initiator DnaA C-terminal domain-containing protein n=1 Tax=Aureimonas endophytica TaxID=2027858 RepID=A0A916ZXS8_9HYPH|nr:helix-turn-helix domain-containing protein [Aureimonas endophytica]GGE18310.1 hypothetical protein GCM10011390_41860 [Aureimonas endophytica]
MRILATNTMRGAIARGVTFVPDPEARRISFEERMRSVEAEAQKTDPEIAEPNPIDRKREEEEKAEALHAAREQRIKEWLATASKFERLSAHSIIRRFSRATGVSVDDLKGPSRKRQIARVRMAAIYWVRRRLQVSYPMIGRVFGGRDHTTVLHSVQRWPQKRLERRRGKA